MHQHNYLGFRVGPRPLDITKEERDGIPLCAAGCHHYSDGWSHHIDCCYVAWVREQAASLAAGESFQEGLPALSHRKAHPGPWQHVEGPVINPSWSLYWFSDDGLMYGTDRNNPNTPCEGPNWDGSYLRPIGITWDDLNKALSVPK